MPCFLHFLKSTLPCTLPLSSDMKKQEYGRRKLFSRAIREKTYLWINEHLLKEAPMDETSLFDKLWISYSYLIEMLVFCDFAGDDIASIPTIPHIMKECDALLINLSTPDLLKHIIDLRDVASEIFDEVINRIRGTVLKENAQPRNSWFIWGQTLLKIARLRLTTSEADEKYDYTACIDLACNMLERCTKYVTDDPHNKHIQNLFSQCESGIGYAYLLKGRTMNNASVKQLFFQKAKEMLLRSINRNQGIINSAYNLACIYCLENDTEACRKWLERALHEDALPHSLYLEKDSDLDNVRSLAWFEAILQRTAQSKSSYTLPLNDLPDGLEQKPNEVWLGDEDMEKMYRSLVRGGLTASVVVDIVKEVYKGKLEHINNTEDIEKQKMRLQKRLIEYSMKDKSFIPSDGNCQFYSLSDQIFNTIDHHRLVRQTIVKWLKDHKEWELDNGAMMKDFVHNSSWEDYCEEMSRNGIWGDHLTLTAAANCYGMKICILSSIEGDNFITELVPKKLKSDRLIFLSHYAEYHYGSITQC